MKALKTACLYLLLGSLAVAAEDSAPKPSAPPVAPTAPPAAPVAPSAPPPGLGATTTLPTASSPIQGPIAPPKAITKPQTSTAKDRAPTVVTKENSKLSYEREDSAEEKAAWDAAVQSGELIPGDIKAFQIKGSVSVWDAEGNNIGKVTRGTIIRQGSTIHTGKNAAALFMFSNGATINIGAESKIEVDLYMQQPFDKSLGVYIRLKEDPSTSKAHLYMHQGEVIGTVKKLQPDSMFDVETPVGTAGVRGTTFYVSFGVNKATGNYLMRISNFDGKVIVDTPLEAEMLMSDGSVAAGQFNPYSGPKLYEVPKKAIVLIEADASLELGSIEEMPDYDTSTTFDEFVESDSIQEMVAEIEAAVETRVQPTVTGAGGIFSLTPDILQPDGPIAEADPEVVTEATTTDPDTEVIDDTETTTQSP